MSLGGAVKGFLTWSDNEDAILRELGSKLEARCLAARLPGRSEVAVKNRRIKLGICKSRRWTPAEDLALEMAWGNDVETIAAELGRTEHAVYTRAYQRGLLGVPRGGESIDAAAKRCGYEHGTMVRILEAAGVEIHPVLNGGPGKKSWRWVDKIDSDAAVKRWMAWPLKAATVDDTRRAA